MKMANTRRMFWKIVDDKHVLSSDFRISPLDRGFLYGDGLFETILCIKNKAIWLNKHISRLRLGSDILKINLDTDLIREKINEIVGQSPYPISRLRLTVTRGDVSSDWRSLSCPSGPNIIIELMHIEKTDHKTVSLASVPIRRDEKSPLSKIKSLNYLPSIIAVAQARELGADDAVMLNTLGEVAESSSSNIFALFGDELVTPPIESGILPGITREIVLEIAPKARLKSREKRLFIDELKEADEIFITNSIKGIVCVSALDGFQYTKTDYAEKLSIIYKENLKKELL